MGDPPTPLVPILVHFCDFGTEGGCSLSAQDDLAVLLLLHQAVLQDAHAGPP